MEERTVLESARDAYWHAREIDGSPREETRIACCNIPLYAFEYALSIDEVPRDDTREAACKDPRWAYEYARWVDKAPSEDTREAASKDPRWAYLYACYIDKIPEEVMAPCGLAPSGSCNICTLFDDKSECGANQEGGES